jgi:hypothetical protein
MDEEPSEETRWFLLWFAESDELERLETLVEQLRKCKAPIAKAAG